MKPILKIIATFYWLPLLLAVTACQSTKPTPGMKLGKPYMIDGKTYYPEYDPSYDKIGTASWYGPGFHGKYTASGELFNQNDLTAAHPTLPMPSLVRVTNLTNGKSLIVRVNDRGPFAHNRIIDLSKKSAQSLGITSLAEVRVQFLKQETEEYIASMQTNGEKPDMKSLNASVVQKKNSSIISSTQPSEQVVESTVSSSHAGQNVTSAAPIVTVGSDELLVAEAPENPLPKPQNTVSTTDLTIPKLNALHIKEPRTTKAQEVKISGLSDPSEAKPAKLMPDVKKEPAAIAKAKVEVGGVVPSAFYIQAGSFASQDNATKLSSKLSSIATADTGKVEMGDKTWWRVRLGPFGTKEEATDALAKVKETGLPDARIVHQ